MTLCGGQCFRWCPTARNTFIGAIHHQVFELREVHSAAATMAHVTKKESSAVVDTALHSATSYAMSASSTVASSSEINGSVGPATLHDGGCGWIEYRKLWPRGVNDGAGRNGATQQGGRARSTGASALAKDTHIADADEELLTRYLSLDVDLAALWTRWTDAPSTRQHPLVTYLIGNSSCATSVASPSALRAAGKLAIPSIPVRHVRQDVHSCLFSFLCSQNNNVTRITSMVYTLCRTYGDHLCDVELTTGEVRPPAEPVSVSSTAKRRRVSPNGVSDAAVTQPPPPKQSKGKQKEAEWLSVYSFPTVTQLQHATEDQLRKLGFGYRSKYVVETVKTITDFPSLLSSSTGSLLTATLPVVQQQQSQQYAVCQHNPFYADLLAHDSDLAYQRAALQGLCGVGRKVADCVLLFSLGHADLVPVDTHMAQVAVEYLAVSAAPKTHSARLSKAAEKNAAEVSRKRTRNEGAAAVPAGDGITWQHILQLWGEKARQLRVEAAKKAKKSKSAKEALKVSAAKSPRKGKAAALASTADKVTDAEGEEGKLPVPPLYDRHHDAIQRGFSELFGSHAGWAHSILFYYRMRK